MPLSVGELGLHLLKHNVDWVEAYLPTKWHLDPCQCYIDASNRLATIDISPKSEGVLCPFMGELGPRLTQCGLDKGLLPYQVAS